MNMDEATRDFLAQRRIAVAGVSREPGGKHGGNVVYQRLRERGYQVFAVNPNADTVEGDPCYRSLGAIEGGVDAVVVATASQAVESVLRDAHELGITRAWMHRSFGKGSVSDEAAAWGRANGMTVIAGGCPLMYGPTSDFGHRAMCFVLGLVGGIPKEA